jgi:hypothetical protein
MNAQKPTFGDLFPVAVPVIGMVHLKALPGTPDYDRGGGVSAIIEAAVEDAKLLQSGGIDAIQVENQFDRPFLKGGEIGPEIVAVLAAAAVEVRRAVSLPMGINVHLNGVKEAIAVAQAAGAQWIRAFEIANAYVSNSGIVEAAGPQALRYRSAIGAESVLVIGDFHVKHGSHSLIADRTIIEQAADVEEAGGDGVIVTGVKTGLAPTRKEIEEIRAAVSVPILVGSGFSAQNAGELVPVIDGVIVGSSLKQGGVLHNQVDTKRVTALMEMMRNLRKERRTERSRSQKR